MKAAFIDSFDDLLICNECVAELESCPDGVANARFNVLISASVSGSFCSDEYCRPVSIPVSGSFSCVTSSFRSRFCFDRYALRMLGIQSEPSNNFAMVTTVTLSSVRHTLICVKTICSDDARHFERAFESF